MRLARVAAGGEGVEPADPVGKPLVGQEFERPVGDRRLVAETLLGQPVEHFVGAHRAVMLEQQCEHAPAHRGEPRAGLGAEPFGAPERLGGAVGVVVRGEGGGGTAGAGGGVRVPSHVSSISGLVRRE